MALIRWNRYGEPTWNAYNCAESRFATGWTPRVDVVEDENGFTVNAELPGLTKEDVNVNVEDGVLTFSGERKFPYGENSDGCRRVERNYGKFERSFRLSDAINPEGITATMDNGVLTVHLPVREESKPRQIAVN